MANGIYENTLMRIIMSPDFKIRIATLAEIPALNRLIQISAQALSQGFYTQEEIDGLNQYVFGADSALIHDETYFIIEKNNHFAACGGFSKRKTLCGGDQFSDRADDFLNPHTDAAKIRAFFVHPDNARQGLATALLHHCEQAALAAGFSKIELMATLPGIPFYSAFGYLEIKANYLTLPNGIQVRLCHMEKLIK